MTPATSSRAWTITGALSVAQVASWGVLYYAFGVFLLPMSHALGASKTELAGALATATLVSAGAGVLVGRHLDRRSPRALMALASAGGAVGVAAWSQVDGLVALYAVFVLLGLVMAGVLYEPAFVVLTKQFPAAGERRRAMTTLTLVAALASFIFLPLSQALVDAHGWRHALLYLAAILAVVTVPLHALILRPAPSAAAESASAEPQTAAREGLRDPTFWVLTSAFGLASIAGFGAIILAVPALLARGYSPGFAAFAAGLIGVSQIPGRLAFAALRGRLSTATSVTLPFMLTAAGLVVVAVSERHDAALIAGLVSLGMGNGMAILARATVLADRYGQAAYGSIAGVAAVASTTARAIAPLAAAAIAAATSYVTLMWTLGGVALVAAVLTTADRRRLSSA